MHITPQIRAAILDADRRKLEHQDELRRIFTDQERQQAEHHARRERVLVIVHNPIRHITTGVR